MPWQWLEALICRTALVFCFSVQAGCQVAGAVCVLHSVEASFSFLVVKWYLPRWLPKKSVLQPAQKSAVVLVQCCFQWILWVRMEAFSWLSSQWITLFSWMVILVCIGVFTIKEKQTTLEFLCFQALWCQANPATSAFKWCMAGGTNDCLLFSLEIFVRKKLAVFWLF